MTREERLKFVSNKKDRLEDRARKIFIFKQKVFKTLNIQFRYVGSK